MAVPAVPFVWSFGSKIEENNTENVHGQVEETSPIKSLLKHSPNKRRVSCQNERKHEEKEKNRKAAELSRKLRNEYVNRLEGRLSDAETRIRYLVQELQSLTSLIKNQSPRRKSV